VRLCRAATSRCKIKRVNWTYLNAELVKLYSASKSTFLSVREKNLFPIGIPLLAPN
jgi:hypothetical protein